jgi:predicted dehydrogenase
MPYFEYFDSASCLQFGIPTPPNSLARDNDIMSSPKTIRWGILATGGIAMTFTKDLLVDPTTRGVKHVKHTVVAAASSSSKSRAEQFLKDCGCPSDAKAYGSYEELVKDPNIDIVYIATPHSHHYQNAMLCLEAGKNVLCEKAFTVNAAQLKALAEKAKAKNLFLMEAVWTRYFPLSIYVREQITSGRIGPVARVFADNSMATNPEEAFADGKSRMVNPDLAGGALLDLGIYSLTWVFQTLYHTQPEDSRKPPQVLAAIKNYGPTKDADETTTMILNFPRSAEAGGDAHAIATTSLRVATAPGGKTDVPGIRIQGAKGEIQVFPPAFRPTRTRIIMKDGSIEEKNWPQPGPGEGSGWRNGFGDSINAEGEGHGMFWEADEAATALVEGRKEGKYESLAESIVIMEVMDEARKQGGLSYPEKIETTKYPTQL